MSCKQRPWFAWWTVVQRLMLLSNTYSVMQTTFCSFTRGKNKFEFKKGVGNAIKSKETSMQVQPSSQQLAITHQPALATCGCLNTIVAGQIRQLRSCTNETHSLAHLQDLIATLAGIYVAYICIIMPAKILQMCQTMYFICAWMQLPELPSYNSV